MIEVSGGNGSKIFVKGNMDMLFRKEIRLEKDYIDYMIYVLFDANRPLTLEEITESVKKHYKFKMKRNMAIWHLDYAVNNGLFSVKSLDEKTTYYPLLSMDEFREKQEEEFQKRLAEGEFSEYFANKFAIEAMSPEEYERIKKLIDELE